MKIKELARMINGTVDGDGEAQVLGLSGIEFARQGDIAFAADDERLAMAEKSAASFVLAGSLSKKKTKTLVRVDNPKLAFLLAYNILNKPETRKAFTHPLASVAGGAVIGKDAWIGPHVNIEDFVRIGDGVIIESNTVIKKNSRIGDSSRIYPNVTIYENVTIGSRVIIHAGCVIGADGFGYVRDGGKIYKFPQLGTVIIEDDVEIGANVAIDRGSLSDTVIGSGTKIDNFCQVAHNVKIGKNVLMAAQCGVSGSTVIKDNVTMGGQAGVGDNLTIGEGAIIGAKSGVSRSIRSGAIVWGIPARDIAETKKQKATLAWMSKNFKRFSALLKEGIEDKS